MTDAPRTAVWNTLDYTQRLSSGLNGDAQRAAGKVNDYDRLGDDWRLVDVRALNLTVNLQNAPRAGPFFYFAGSILSIAPSVSSVST
jgi:hypothetical protein